MQTSEILGHCHGQCGGRFESLPLRTIRSPFHIQCVSAEIENDYLTSCDHFSCPISTPLVYQLSIVAVYLHSSRTKRSFDCYSTELRVLDYDYGSCEAAGLGPQTSGTLGHYHLAEGKSLVAAHYPLSGMS